MSVRRRQNWLGQQRVDLSHLKSVESAVSNDFDELISGLVIGENKSYVVRGFKISMPGSILGSASNLQLIVENSAILHGNSNESGTFYKISSDTPSEILDSTVNTKVEGNFAAGTDNFVGIEFVRKTDNTTADQVIFWNPTSNVEFPKTVPLGIILEYKIVIKTASFSDNVLPIAVIKTDTSNKVLSITDRRPLLFRLGSAGSDSPDPFYEFPWGNEGRVENFYTSNSSLDDPFYGGDKQISNMKDFFDALMTELKIIKGTPFWYSQNTGSLTRLRQDIANTVFTGKGTIIHGAFDFQGIVTGLTSDIILKTVNTSSIGDITLIADGNDIDTLIINHNVSNPDSQVYLFDGDGSQIPTADITLTSKSGQINWVNNIYLNFIGGKLRYTILDNEGSNQLTLSDDEVAYISLIRGVNITPNLVFSFDSDIVTSADGTAWTADLLEGDFIKDASKGDEYYYEIAEVINGTQVKLTEKYLGEDTAPNGIKCQYAFGVYGAEGLAADRLIKKESRNIVPFEEDTFWLFYRQDNDGSIPKIYVRALGGQELEQGEWKQISDNTSINILQYIGSASEIDIDPDYTNSLGVSRTNIHLIDDENLTKGLKRLEQRDDVIPRVRTVDILSTSLPTGASVTIDGETLNDNDYVMFTSSPIEGLYKVSGVGVAVVFEKLHAFGGEQSPVNGDLIRVEAGTEYFKTIWKRVSGYWKPVEVEDAVKEPTGFPNRTDSEITFNNGTRTLSIAPLAPATYFDIFAKGRVFRFNSAQEITVPDTEGIFFFYFELDGTLNYTNTFDITIITQKVYVANIYWDSTNQEAIILGDERHGITLDAATHEYLHNLNGTVITSGGAINFSTYIETDIAAQFDGQVAGMTTDVIIDADVAGSAGNVTLIADSITDIDGLILAWNTANPSNTLTLSSGDGSQIPTADITLSGGLDASGDLDSDAQITLGNIVIRDEDIRMDITNSASPTNPFEQILDPIAEIPVFYRDGASGDWRRDTTTQFPVKQGTSRIQFNDPSGPWTQTDVQEGYYVSMWIFATNNFNEPVIAILGQKEHALLSDAQEQDTYDSLNFGIMPVQEFKVLYRIIFQSSSAFTNTPRAALVDVRDLRAAVDTQFAQVSPNDHSLLSGLADPDHAPTAVTTAGVTKDGGLSASDIDLQQSLDTLNKLLGQLIVTEHPTNKKRVKISGVNRVLNSTKNISKTLENLLLDFEGAEVDFSTGEIFKQDGITALGENFTPATIPVDEYIYYSITMVYDSVSSKNLALPVLIVNEGASTNSDSSLAPRASYEEGIHLAQILVRQDVSDIYDILTQDITQILDQGVKELPLAVKGDLLVFNGQEKVALPVGTADQILTADPTSPTGLKWADNAGLGGIGLDEEGNFNLEIVQEPLQQWILESSLGSKFEVTIETDGSLTTTPSTDPVTALFILKNDLNEDCAIKIDNSGVLFVESPPLDPGIETINVSLQDTNGYSWKVTVVKNGLGINEIVTDTFNNKFLVKTENSNHFAVLQSDEDHALTYTQVYDSVSLPATPTAITGLLPYCFYDSGSFVRPIYWDGSNWRYFHDNSLV